MDGIQVSFEPRDGYLCVHASGRFTPDAARAVFADMIEQARTLDYNRILCDVTRMQGMDVDQASITARFDMGVFVAETLPSDFRLAVLVAPQQLMEDRFDENVMMNRGAVVTTTTSIDEAFEWLGVAEIDAAAGE